MDKEVILYYPVLEAVIQQNGKTLTEIADLLDISTILLHKKRTGRFSWHLEECLLLRDSLAPALSIEELFYILPNLEKRNVTITEAEMRGGFNPNLYR